MGFSVSGATAILFAATLIAFGMWHSAATDSFERVSEAKQDRADDALAEGNTDVAITRAFHDGSGTLEVDVENRGATALSLNGTDVVVDNEYRSGWQGDARIDGSAVKTDLWLPGETVTIVIDSISTPDRVKVTTERGVSDTSEVTT
jgi:flagellar protein FlaF